MSSVHQVFLAVIRRFLKANFKKSIVLSYDKQIRLESANFRVFFLLFENFFEPDYTAGLLVPVTNASKNASKTQDK